jgi:hypothetical protein
LFDARLAVADGAFQHLRHARIVGPFDRRRFEVADGIAVSLLDEIEMAEKRADLARPIDRIELEGAFEGGDVDRAATTRTSICL